jgi:hypothetical protein
LLVLLLEECSLEFPLGELSLDDNEFFVVVVGASTTAGATITGAGGAISGAWYTVKGSTDRDGK